MPSCRPQSLQCASSDPARRLRLAPKQDEHASIQEPDLDTTGSASVMAALSAADRVSAPATWDSTCSMGVHQTCRSLSGGLSANPGTLRESRRAQPMQALKRNSMPSDNSYRLAL